MSESRTKRKHDRVFPEEVREQDTYSPFANQIPLRQQPMRSHARSPLAAAQEALDAVHETHLAKGRDWNQLLPLQPEVAKTEFENALEATVTEATTLWTGRKEGIPTVMEVEQIRQNSVDMSGPYNADKREQRNFDRGVDNAQAILRHFSLAKAKWGDRISNMTLSERNALAMIAKPVTDDEIELQRIMKDFMKRLDCASIIAECEKGAGYLDTLPKPGAAMQ